jgi:hypothetical protein
MLVAKVQQKAAMLVYTLKAKDINTGPTEEGRSKSWSYMEYVQ